MEIIKGLESRESGEDLGAKIQGKIWTRWSDLIANRIDFAEALAQPREKWPQELNKFPIKYFKKVQKIILKFLNVLFRDQRTINIALLNAQRESLAQIHRLLAIILSTSTKVRTLESSFDAQGPTGWVPSSSEERKSLEDFYTAFEEKFRGSEEVISERLEHYSSTIREAGAGCKDFPILDIGCGRGEWLSYLASNQLSCIGVDTNSIAIHRCREKRLEVFHADVMTFLRELPDNSLGAVTGFHIIEHLPLNVLLQLFKEVFRTLRSGGVFIFETPNPQNLLTASTTFYLDPTHRNPLPAPLVQFMAEFNDFKRLRVHGSSAYPESMKLTGSALADRFNEYFYCHQDYALIGYK